MVPTLLIRLHNDGAAEWLALGRDGRALAQPQPGLPTQGAEQVWVIVPAEDVLLLSAPRVSRQRSQLEQAVPFAIEEQLAAPIEQQHVALEQGDHAERVGVAVVANDRLDAWLSRLRDAAIEADRLLPEHTLLPLDADGATLLVEGGRAVLRHAPHAAISGKSDDIVDWLALLAAEGRPQTRLRCVGPRPAALQGMEVAHEQPASMLAWFAAQSPGSSGIDLLQGRYAPRRRQEGTRRIWRWAALLAAAAVLSAFGHLVIERHQLEQRNLQQRAEMEQLLRSAVPGITRIVDPKAQLTAEYARLGRSGGSGALPLLARIAPSIAGSGRYTIDGIEFRADTLELVVLGADIASLDSLRERLGALALQVELTSANPGSAGVEGRLRIRSGTP